MMGQLTNGPGVSTVPHCRGGGSEAGGAGGGPSLALGLALLGVTALAALTATALTCRRQLGRLQQRLAWRRTEEGIKHKEREYQRSFIQYDEYFLSLARWAHFTMMHLLPWLCTGTRLSWSGVRPRFL